MKTKEKKPKFKKCGCGKIISVGFCCRDCYHEFHETEAELHAGEFENTTRDTDGEDE